MRLHTSTLTEDHVRNAARKAGVTIEHLSAHGSRKAARAYEVALSGKGKTGGQWGGGGYKSALWDEWGIFLGELYRHDASMIAGNAYQDAEHFRWITGNRYDTLTPDQVCLRHRWDYSGRVVTGSFFTYDCPRCGAHMRRLAHGYHWEDVA
jgi:hypothetical protein